MGPLARRLAATINRTGAVNGVPFASPVAMTPRVHERRASWVHYGVMAPGLPEPHRQFGVMAILGTTGVRCFDNDHAITTTPRDTAYVVAGTAADADFRAYAMSTECALASDGSRLAFGEDELVFEGRYPDVRVRRAGPVPVELELAITDKVAYFSRLCGLYDHWSLLASYRGTVGGDAVSGLCTYEYARGIGPYSLAREVIPASLKTPIATFTYQVLNLSARDQLLLTVAGPSWRRPLHEGAWERGLDDHGEMHRDARLTVSAHRAEPLPTPDGRAMRMPAAWSWEVRDEAGAPLAALELTARDDWRYGLGAGFVGSAAYTGTVRGREVRGSAYVEWVDT
jgi:hypothetical protein